MRRITVAAVFVLIAMAATVNAQQGTGDLRGKIVDSQQAVMPGVTVTVRNQENGTFRTTVSGVDGSFFVSAMNPGVYQVEAMLDGFRPYERKDVRLEVGRTVTVDVTLELGGIEERLTVTAEAPLVDTTSKEVGGSVTAQEFVNTPSLNRSFSGFLGMVPGIVSTVSTSTFGGDTISVGGQGARNVAYTMDGSDNNDGLTGGGTSSQARVPIEAVQEFKVVTSQFDAEYGGTSGAIVNAVSKSGTNIFHGSGFAFYQDQNFASQNFFAKQSNLDEAPTTMQQYGGTIGGPIVRDKMHFFFSLERILFDNGVTVNVPTRPDLNRNEFGVSRNWNTFIRFDNQLNSANTWGVRWLREASPQPKQVDETWTASRNAEETDVDQTFLGTLSSVIGSTMVNTLRLSYTSEDPALRQPDVPRQRLRSGGVAAHARASVVRRRAEPDGEHPPAVRLRHRRLLLVVRAQQGRRSRVEVRRLLQLHPAALPGFRRPRMASSRFRVTRTSTRQTRSPIRSACRFACRERPDTACMGPMAVHTRRTAGRWATT